MKKSPGCIDSGEAATYNIKGVHIMFVLFVEYF